MCAIVQNNKFPEEVSMLSNVKTGQEQCRELA